MATTTTNFGWDIPQSTDLVKDGATAIAALGQDIDTALVDLKGGTTGQILAKASDTNLDYSWITNDVGDITEVTAGTGISGGGTSGAVTVTNSMATAIDAKGDLIGGTGADAFARLAVGANGTILTADSVETTGLKWIPNPGSGPAFQAYRGTSNQNPTGFAWTKVQLNAEDYDTDSCFDSTTNYRFTPTVAGKYLFGYAANTNNEATVFAVYKNGSLTKYFPINSGTVTLEMNGSSDYVEFYILVSTASPILYFGSDSNTAFGNYIRS